MANIQQTYIHIGNTGNTGNIGNTGNTGNPKDSIEYIYGIIHNKYKSINQSI